MKLSARTLHRVIALGLAAGLLALALPQSIDASMRLYAEAQVAPSDVSSAPPAAAAIALLDTADRWFDDPEARIDAGIAAFRRAYRSADEPDRAGMREAARDFTSGLSRRPGDRWAWMYLAHADLAAGNAGAARDAFRTAILVAPYDPDLSLWRTELGLYLWPELGADDRRLVAEQMETAWAEKPQNVLALANTPLAVAILREGLVSSPTALDAFDTALRRR